MLIIIILSLVLITGILIRMFAKKFKRTGYTLTIVGGVGLLITLISIPISRLIITSELEQFRIMKEMLTQQKIKIYADTQKEIIEKNQWLARVQFLNTTILDIWIPDRVMWNKPLLLSKESSEKLFKKEKNENKLREKHKWTKVEYVPPEKTKKKDKYWQEVEKEQKQLKKKYRTFEDTKNSTNGKSKDKPKYYVKPKRYKRKFNKITVKWGGEERTVYTVQK